MKKIFVLLALVFLITGCSVKEVTTKNLEKVIDEVLTSRDDLHNQYFAGYQYYLPRGVSLIKKYNYNTTLLYKGNKMYFYVDIISYHHKIVEEYAVDEDIYYSQLLNDGDKKGYINIYKENDKYYVDIEYNYGKIETYTNEINLSRTIINSLYILKTLNYNDTIIDSLIGENKIEYKEEKFDLFKSEGNDGDYLDIMDKDDNLIKDDDEILDDDNIDLKDNDELNN